MEHEPTADEMEELRAFAKCGRASQRALAAGWREYLGRPLVGHQRPVFTRRRWFWSSTFIVENLVQ